MNWLDLVLLLAALSFGFSGYRQGFVVGVLAFAGFIGGGIGGIVVAPSLTSGIGRGLGQTVLALALVLLAATVGQVVLAWLGSLVRDRLTWRPARVVDATLGALVSVLAMLLVTWFLASALRPGPVPTLSRQIGDSQVITTFDEAVPERAHTLFSSFRRILDSEGLPKVFGGLSPERIRPVDPPSQGVTSTPAVRRAGTSVVRVTGTAQDCDRRLDGTGFVVSEHHVVTNAHVVAGVERPEVQIGGDGRAYRSRVVSFDPGRDLAVLYVPDLPARPLDLDPSGGRGDEAVVAGFPGGGPYRLGAARIRDTINARGPDIYQRTQVTREVFSLLADVEPGNSGGPLLTLDGAVYGVVFAKSLDDPDTGYALTIDEARPIIDAGRARTAPVDTGACT
ncbi:MAG: MarP family serine protease [Sporichthyaceae bacterium]|nr:MarP family serine protease [Sporichthyaceae bacterium]